MRRVLACGGRSFSDRGRVFAALDNLHASIPFELLIHGGAQGADDLADAWARERGIVRQMYRPNWKAHGRAAGPIRNQRMIDEGKPTIVVAFTGGAGTADMCRRAIAAGLVVVLA